MKIGDLVESAQHPVRGIVVAVSDWPYDMNSSRAKVAWFDGDRSLEYQRMLRVVSYAK